MASDYYDRLRKVISRLTYKIGWSFSVLPGDYHPDAYAVRIVAIWPDVNQELGEIPVQRDVHFFKKDDMSEEYILATLYTSIQAHEQHEQDEWFRVDGQVYREPHPEQHRGRSYSGG